MSRRKIVNGRQYEGYQLLNYDFYQTILDKMIERLEFMLNKHSQVLIVRLLVRFPTELASNGDNGCFQYFMEAYRRHLKAEGFDPQYAWVREQAFSHNHHYHVLLLLNGNKIRYYRYPTKANEIWSDAIARYYSYVCPEKGLIQMCDGKHEGIPMNHGIMIHRSNEALKQEAFLICSYLAKVYTKGNAPKYVREFGASMMGGN